MWDSENAAWREIRNADDVEPGDVLYVDDGSASLPAIAPLSDPDSGIYFPTAAALNFAFGGFSYHGSAAVPSLAFSGAATNGFYRATSGVGVSVAGANVATFETGMAPFMKRAVVPLTQANLENLAATPIELVAAEVGKMHFVTAVRIRIIFVTTAFDDAAADGDFIVKYAGGNTIQVIQADGLVDAVASSQSLGIPGNIAVQADSAVDNVAIQISNDGAEFTVVGGGDSTGEVEIFYYTLDTDPS
jgi:hypothetical protein